VPSASPSSIGGFIIGLSPIGGAFVPPPPIGDTSPYLKLVTSEHNTKPNFMASLTALLQPLADQLVNLESLPTLFDLDTAVGQQLDFTGQWIGPSRVLDIAITGVFFTWDTALLGWDQGAWLGPFPPSQGITSLGDDLYRKLLFATVAANTWDGTIPKAYTSFNDLFSPLTVAIKDNGNMTMTVTLSGSPDAITAELFSSGALALRPAGVAATYVIA
jgi:hypothetical protein